ncbi:MAG TPA: TIGR04283 family arsenosugar biosynthesis glycosyltransferase [Acetobacteraceae bacterium]|jgi:rSAM/selenodomain-associated transferase 2|nr:TIGR04283 family arsenosugar biosynthesis glycosyltransferase [Acetobacteraceae bacterium]
MLSIVIPALNASGSLRGTLASATAADEAVVVDGGSVDGTADLAASLGARVFHAQRGRGSQLAAGIEAAQGEWLLLLHADTRLAVGWQTAIGAHMVASPGRAGYCRFRLDSDDRRARHIERLVAWRCRVFALPYGDQGLLIHRDLLREVGGVRPLPLMEDVDLILRLGRRRLAPLDVAAITSADKWQRQGWYRRSLRNLLCLTLYFIGVPTRLIARLYA